MLHPVFRLAASQPQLLAEHAAGYALLVAEEVATSGAHLKRRIVLQVVGLLGLLGGALLGGVALMLWAVMPLAHGQMVWLLWATPLVPAVLGAVALATAQNAKVPPAFSSLREQLAQDAALLRSASAP